jgi:hypothetical protein
MKNLRKYIRKIITESLMEDFHVYHGTDRSFDSFSMDKVGSGDGKSLGGWGIYFSDSERVSERYFLKGGSVKEYDIKEGNYFNLDDYLDEGTAYQFMNKLRKMGVNEDELEVFQSDYIDYIPNIDNKQAYDWLSGVLGSEKNASLFLNDLGYVGNTFKDKWEPEATNYVLFDTKYIRQY